MNIWLYTQQLVKLNIACGSYMPSTLLAHGHTDCTQSYTFPRTTLDLFGNISLLASHSIVMAFCVCGAHIYNSFDAFCICLLIVCFAQVQFTFFKITTIVVFVLKQVGATL